jgi:hypothetical protein
VARAYLNYSYITTLSYDMVNQLVVDRNAADTAITISKFQNEMGLIKLDDYKGEYVKLLKLICGNTTMEVAHYEELVGAFTAGQTAIKSTETHTWVGTAGGINWVVQPEDALGLGAYGFVGTAVVSFDRTVNVNTKYISGYNADGTPIIKNLYE